MPTTIPRAPDEVPPSIRNGLVVAARAWFDDPIRPRIAPDMLAAWDELLESWSADPTLPLLIRKARDNRGHALVHGSSGRTLVPTDNSPAHWSIALALCGACPSIQEVRDLFGSDRVPVAMVIKATEKLAARYRCTRTATIGPNQMGWKVAHIEDVGLGYTDVITAIQLPDLQAHFCRFLSPRNMFLVPKAYAGVAETPEFINAFRQRAEPV
jgi:hypothetical protein